MLGAIISRSKPAYALLLSRGCFLAMPAQSPSTGFRYFHSKMNALDFNCGILAEPIERYEPGGYHPVQLGDTLKKQRYKIVHKLGWGSFSTTWLALDQTLSRCVALKICIPRSPQHARSETSILETISNLPKESPGRIHVIQMLDTFILNGPNGVHTCIVLEPLGPCISQFFEDGGSRLSGFVMKAAARQTLQAINFLSSHRIGHGGKFSRQHIVNTH